MEEDSTGEEGEEASSAEPGGLGGREQRPRVSDSLHGGPAAGSEQRRGQGVCVCVWLWVVRVADSFACSQVHENQIVLDKDLRRRQL